MSYDIRNYFGNAAGSSKPAKPTLAAKPAATAKKSTNRPKQRTALTDEANRAITPPPTKRSRADAPSHAHSSSSAQRPCAIILSETDESDDPESPLDRKTRQKLKKKQKPKRIAVNSDSENDVSIVATIKKKSTSPKKPAKAKSPVKKKSPVAAKKKAPITATKMKSPVPAAKKTAPTAAITKKNASAKNSKAEPRVRSKPQQEPLNLLKPNEKLEQWVDKYRPKNIKELVGQNGDSSQALKLCKWLQAWPRHNLGAASSQKKAKPALNTQNDGTAYKAALLSGPPGVGKTTTAQIVCDELGLRYAELNASVARSKKLLEQKIGQLLHCRRIDEYFGTEEHKSTVESKNGDRVTHVIIMDECDGMSGNADRSGITELILLIKKTEIPIICICNDRNSSKVRSLANHCFDLRFNRPRLEQIMPRLMTILFRQQVKLDKADVENIVKASNQDLRQAIYSLELVAAGADLKSGDIVTKDVSINIFEAARRLLSSETDLQTKRELFFVDYSIMPLFVQEHYLSIRMPSCGRRAHIRMLRKAANSIAIGDQISRQMRNSQQWSLLPLQGLMSTALPMIYLNGTLCPQINFPSWLGKNSTHQKRVRLLAQLNEHVGLRMSGPRHAIALDYLPLLQHQLLSPLRGDDSACIEEVQDVCHAYSLVRDDIDAINELCTWPNQHDPWHNIASKTKSALTRALNKDPHRLPFTTANDVQVTVRTSAGKRKAAKAAKESMNAMLAAEKKVGALDDDDDESDDEAAALGDAEDEEHMAEILNAL